MDQTRAIQRQFGAAAARYATSTYHQRSPDLAAILTTAPRVPSHPPWTQADSNRPVYGEHAYRQ